MRIATLSALAVVAPVLILAQPPQAAKTTPAISPIRQELLSAFNSAAREATMLAKAVPQEQYSYSPMEGVRTFGEVFMHMGGSTLLLGSYAGLKMPDGPAHDLATVYMKRGFEMPEIFASEAVVKDKAQIIPIMEQCFNAARDMIRNIPDSALDEKVSFFGTDVTKRQMLILMGNHLHEHLGQAIAYARVNHIVPPWSQPKAKQTSAK